MVFSYLTGRWLKGLLIITLFGEARAPARKHIGRVVCFFGAYGGGNIIYEKYYISSRLRFVER